MDYMASEERSLAEDCKLFIKIFEEEFVDSEELEQILEEKSLYWSEDLPYALTWCCNTFKNFAKGESWSMLPLYHSELLTGEGVERLCFDVIDIFQFYHEDIAVTVGEDGYAHKLPCENKKLNKHWFTFNYYYNKSYVNNDSYVYEEGIDIAELHRKINKIYGKDIEKPDGFYVTAKVYKGIFIPIAIYIEDTKVISFLQNS